MVNIAVKRGNKTLIKAEIARGFRKVFGLMFSKQKNILLEAGYEGILSSSIHMLFVFFPIDVVWLDKNKKIVDIKTAYPFQIISMPKKPAKYILELKKGKGKLFRTGNKLKF